MKLFNSQKNTVPKKLSGVVKWNCPSNIALVKYWGKKEYQLPSNPSLSFSLNKCITQTEITYEYCEKNQKISFEIINSDIKADSKLNNFFKVLTQLAPVFDKFSFKIQTHNNFPHSAGIASSASAYGALALCLLDIEKEVFELEEDKDFFKRASSLARLGSGSASRSIYGGFNSWGETKYVENSTDEFAVSIKKVHEDFKCIKDLICIVDDGPKSVSSSAGHKLMNEHPFKEQRFSQARENINSLLSIIETGDWESFNGVVENEALTLHALMMSSQSSYMLMTPKSLKVIELVKKYQKQNVYLTYTMDAGPNVHILYHPEKCDVIQSLRSDIEENLDNISFIDDEIGQGPVKL